MSTHLGKISFLDLPDVNGQDIVIVGSGTTNQISTSQSAGTLTIGLASNPIVPGNAAIRLPIGTTAQRAVSPSAGDTRFNSTLGVAEVFNGSIWFPAAGKVLQMVTGSISPTTGTTQVPFDTTSPLSTEGFQIWSQAVTPLSATSVFLIGFNITQAHGTVGRVFTTSVFAGTTNIGGACAAISATTSLATPIGATNTAILISHAPGSTAAITFSARTGTNGAGTAYVNQGVTATMGSSLTTDYWIMEIQQ